MYLLCSQFFTRSSHPLVSVVGAAAIARLLPNAHGGAVTNPTAEVTSSGNAPLAQQSAPVSVAREIVRYKTVVPHEYPRRHETACNPDRAQSAQADQSRDYRQAPTYQQPAPVAQNSPLGMSIGALLGGLGGSHSGGGYVGNEIAKRNLLTNPQ